MGYILARLSEASTWAGVSAMAGAVAASSASASVQYAAGLIVAVCGALAVFMKAHPAAP